MLGRHWLFWTRRYWFVYLTILASVIMIYTLITSMFSMERHGLSDDVVFPDIFSEKLGILKSYRKGRNIGGSLSLDQLPNHGNSKKQLSPQQRPRKHPPRKAPIDYGRNRDLDVEGVADYMMWYENFQREPNQMPVLARQQMCTKPVQNIAFLKTHYTGSDVITSILNRNADLKSLHMALPIDGLSTFYWPMRFQWKYIDITMLNGSLPNIISNHARYNGDVMDNIMGPGTIYLTILRDPVTQLETTFNNLQFSELLEIHDSIDPLKSFLSDPKFYIQGVIKKKKFKDSLNLIKNAMFFDLGLSTTEYHKRNIIKATIYELFERFSLVMIYEYLDESLVLMKRRLCWEMDDVVYLSFHHTSHNRNNRLSFDKDLIDMIRTWNSADNQLYQYFNDTLWKEIGYEGKGFWEELKQFREYKGQIERDCVGKHVEESEGSTGLDRRQENNEFSELNPDVSNWNRYFCEKLLLSEVGYLNYFRKKEEIARSKRKK